MQILKTKSLYIPAFSIIAVVLLLLLLVGISTHRNLDRDKRKSMAFVHRQGVMLLRALEAGARAEMMMQIWQEDSVANLIREVAKDQDIAYIYLFDKTGTITHHSERTREGEGTPWDPTAFEKGWVNSRLKVLENDFRVYELAKLFSPGPPLRPMRGMHRMMNRENISGGHLHAGNVIVIGLKMTAFDEARQADLHHAVIMATIVLVLGSGALFFVFVIQNYYLVDATLKQTKDYTQKIVGSMANGLLSADSGHRIVSYNPLCLKMLGLEDKHLRSKTLDSLQGFRSTGIMDLIDSGRTIADREIEYIRPNGERVFLGISISPILEEDGSAAGTVMLLRDLGPIKQLEEKVRRTEKLAAIGKLAAGVAHEIRNPLSSIRGFAQFLGHALKDRPKEQEYAHIMIREMDRINNVVTDLLSFASPRPAEPSPTDISELLTHVVQLVAPDAKGKRVTVDTQISSGMKNLMVDAHQLTQAVLNLLLNSLKSVEKGGSIVMKTGLDDEGSRFLFSIQDNGKGIPPENRKRIFEPFFTTRESGTGLGLAIVHKIVENHHGEIDVESPPPGKRTGCRFTISIPFETKTSQ